MWKEMKVPNIVFRYAVQIKYYSTKHKPIKINISINTLRPNKSESITMRLTRIRPKTLYLK